MIFTYKKWENFCYNLSLNGMKSIPACCVTKEQGKYLVLKHDVETDVSKALKIAEIEQKYGHRGSYYVQGYLMNDSKNIKMLKEMQKMGHEISYHYDVMDSNKGNISKALLEFEKNRKRFEDNGFAISTVCQHGNPIVERVGYYSNRDFFRNKNVQERYSQITDIMVNFKTFRKTNYTYFSDAGRKFKMIFDPINNDIVNSDDKNIEFSDLRDILEYTKKENSIVSIHPHRWTPCAIEYIARSILFKTLKITAKLLIKVPLAKKIMSKYYYLAKKV